MIEEAFVEGPFPASMAEPADLPDHYSLGDEFDWSAGDDPCRLIVELPFWLLVPNTTTSITCGRREFDVHVLDDFEEVHMYGLVSNDKGHMAHIGPSDEEPPLVSELGRQGVTFGRRPCRTVMTLATSCNRDVLASVASDEERRVRVAKMYLADLCVAHLHVINSVIRAYRLATQDPFVYEVGPWDVPIWYADVEGVADVIVRVPYLAWNGKPEVHEGGSVHPHELIDAAGLQDALALAPSPGELDLLDSANLLERGDFAGAVRRIATALEVALAAALWAAVADRFPADEVAAEVGRNETDFFRRFKQYMAVSGRGQPTGLWESLEEMRRLRRLMVHEGYRLEHRDRWRAEKGVVTGRWLFNWIEQDESRARRRETGLARRSLGRAFFIFDPDPCGHRTHE